MIQELSAPVSIPDHELLRLIGRGSYGEVWLARNIMGVYRAIKVIRRSSFDSSSPFERELSGIRRFEPISRTHEGFVDILQVGWSEKEACLYYIMEAADDVALEQAINPETYVPKTLGKALAQVKRFPVEQVAQMGMALCQALDHLHRQGLVHRDIKPSNIVFVNGAVKLADIGLVTESENARSFVGTEGFIPPEGPGTKQADIYGLGKALYEIASGRDRLDFPALPADLPSFADGDQFLELNEVLIRACRQSAANRYASVRDMYEDLALLVSGSSLRRLRLLERRWEKAKRGAIITAAVAVGVAVLAFPIIQERQHSEEIRERQIGVRSANGINKMGAGDLPGALVEFSEIYKLEEHWKNRLLANQIRIGSIIAQAPKIDQMFFQDGRIHSVVFHPDSAQKRILAVEKTQTSKRCIIFDLVTGKHVGRPIEGGLIGQAEFSPDGRGVVIADEVGVARLINLQTGEEASIEHPRNVMFAAFSPDGERLATACYDGIGRVWNAKTREKLFELTGHAGPLRCVKFSPDGKLILTTSEDETARLWDAATGSPGPVLHHPDWVMHGTFSPDSRFVATGGHDNWARLWNTRTGEELPTLMKHDDVVRQVDFSPCGMMILTGSTDGTVRLWDAGTRMPLANQHVLRHSSAVLSVAFAGNGHQFVTGCADGSVRVWDLVSPGMESVQLVGTINNAGSAIAAIRPGAIEVSEIFAASKTNRIEIKGEIRELALSDNASTLAALIGDTKPAANSLRIWGNLRDDSCFEVSLNSSADPVTRITFSKDGSLLGFRDADVIRIVDVSREMEWTIPQEFKNGEFAFHPIEKSVAIANGNTVQVMQLGVRPVFPTPLHFDGGIRHLAFSPDGRLILVSQADSSVNPRSAVLIDASTGKRIGPEVWGRDGILQGAFSPDSLRVITAGEDREALLWETRPERTILHTLPHPHQVLGVAFSQEGRWIGATAGDATVRIWDNETGQPLSPPIRCPENASRIIFLKGGHQFATLPNSTRFSLWTLPKLDIPAEDVLGLGHLLNSDLRVAGKTGSGQISEAWNVLRRKYPASFVATPAQISRWHDRQRQLALRSKQPGAVKFHEQRRDLSNP